MTKTQKTLKKKIINGLFDKKTNHQKISSKNKKDKNDFVKNFKIIYPNSKEKFNSGKWSLNEHKSFIMGVFLYGNYWTDIQKLIKTRSTPQALSHSQKFFLKLKKMKFFDKDYYSAKKIKELFRIIKNEEKLKLIEKLIKSYFKEYELPYINKYIYNANNNINVNNDFIGNSLIINNDNNFIGLNKNQTNIKYNLIEIYNENFFIQNIKEDSILNLFSLNKREEIGNLITHQLSEIELDKNSNFNSSNMNTSCFKYIEKFLNFCQEGIFKNVKSDINILNKNNDKTNIVNINGYLSEIESIKGFNYNYMNYNFFKNDLERKTDVLNINCKEKQTSIKN